MERPVVALDFDDTLADTCRAVIEHARAMGAVPPGQVQTGFLALPRHVLESFHDAESPATTAPVPGAPEACRAFVARGFRIVVVTARDPMFRAATSLLADSMFPGLVEDVVCVGHGNGKSSTLARIGAALFVDDLPRHAREAEESGIPSLLFGDLPWNRTFRHGLRARTWAEAIPMALDALERETAPTPAP